MEVCAGVCVCVSQLLHPNDYLDYGARGEVHLYDKHDRDPDDGAYDHEPAQNHGPGGVSVVLICHHLPLVQAEYQDALYRQQTLTFNTKL